MKVKVVSRCIYHTSVRNYETSHELFVLLKLKAQLLTQPKFDPACHIPLYV